MLVVHDPSFGMRRDDFAGLELRLVIQDETREFCQFLRGEELVQNHAFSRKLLRAFCCRNAGLRNYR